jgi:hypothetical protein
MQGTILASAVTKVKRFLTGRFCFNLLAKQGKYSGVKIGKIWEI